MNKAFWISSFACLLLAKMASAADGPGNDPKGWKDVPWGTPSSAFVVEGAETVAEKSTTFIRGEELTLKFSLKDYRVAGIPYTVSFYFDHGDRFSAYTLTYSSDYDAINDAYRELTRLLTIRYGPARYENEKTHYGRFRWVEFLGPADGDQDPFNIPKGKALIRVTFVDSNQDEADKL